MATLSIVSFPIQNYRRPGTSARLKIWYSQDFVTPESLKVMGGTARSGPFHVDELCSADPDTHVLTIPTFSLPTTDDSSIRNVRATGVLFDSSGAFVQYLFTNWIIYSQLAPTSTFASLEALNSPPTPPPQPSGITREQALVLIREGLTVESINGTLSDNTVPRADGPKTLVDGLASDDGVNWSVQTTQYVQLGDYGASQNHSFIDVNDNMGRANLFAGAEEQAQYAGIAALATIGDAEVFLQTTDYTNFYAHRAVSKMGDTQGDNNSTAVTVDDENQMVVQSARNAAPVDAQINNEEACFFLDEDTNALKVRVRLSDGTYKTGSIALD